MIPRALRRSSTIFLAAFALSCASSPVSVEPPPSAPDDLLWVRSSAEYPALCLQAYRLATLRLEELVQGRSPGTWAVSLDADETILSNSLYEKERWLAGSAFQDTAWAQWVDRREATALPGAAAFLERVRALGGKIAVVTNRTAAQCAATRENLDRLSLLYDVVLCRSEVREKEPRWESLRTGTAAPSLGPLEIVLWIGDNIQDFPELTQESRHAPGALDDFAGRFILLPNPMYGSWERTPLE